MKYYYEICEEFRTKGFPAYVYEQHYDNFLCAISNRVFELKDKTLICIDGDVSESCIESKETTFILLSAKPRTSKLFHYFDPGHA